MRRFWKNISNRDRLCYALVIAFGICLLTIMLFFTFGYQLGEIKTNPFIRWEENGEAKMLLIDEPNPVIRGIEIGVAVGMIILGAERLKTYKRRRLTSQG